MNGLQFRIALVLGGLTQPYSQSDWPTMARRSMVAIDIVGLKSGPSRR
jgi:hypothetical protein